MNEPKQFYGWAPREAVASCRLDGETQTVGDEPPYVLISEKRLKAMEDVVETLAAEVERLSAEVHECPECGECCKYCQCWDTRFATATGLLREFLRDAGPNLVERAHAFLAGTGKGEGEDQC